MKYMKVFFSPCKKYLPSECIEELSTSEEVTNSNFPSSVCWISLVNCLMMIQYSCKPNWKPIFSPQGAKSQSI